jgi:pyruvate/2-oxoglutarate dehydrogenase complex dihydrolipoamide dehydrogenase (E3) component
MVANYDLVVIGATAAAEAAAIDAAQTHARVAWVPNASFKSDPLLLLREGSRRFAGLKRTVSAQDWRLWSNTLIAATQQSPSIAQSYGVEYIEGNVRFERDEVWVGDRQLRSRAYLLALNAEQTLPNLEGINHPKVWTIAQLWKHLQDSPWPQSIAILGNGPQAVELGQGLGRLGISVLLIAGDNPLLPKEDEDVAFLLQCYLEGDSIQFATRGSVRSIQSAVNDGLLLEVGNSSAPSVRKYTAEALVTATEGNWRLPKSLEPLNLLQTQWGIAVNAALQTSNPRIYAIGSLLGGYSLPSIALHEAKHAVHNALFEKQLPLKYHQLPYAILSDPALARVGLTEAQARRYDPQVQVLRADFRECGGTHPERNRARLDSSPVGLCKVLVQKDGTIVGAYILAEAAAELIHLFALAMQHEIRLQGLGQLGYVSLTFAEVVGHITDQWWQQQHRRDRNERWFYNRRQRIR